MQIAGAAVARPADLDMWMVRVTRTAGTDATRGSIERYTGVDLDPEDTTPGVHPLLFEQGRLERAASGDAWSVHRTRVEAWRHDDARAAASAMYDAARGFLALDLPPARQPVPLATPDLLRIEIGDLTWTFTPASAPVEAWRILAQARRIHEDALATFPTRVSPV